MSTYKFCGGTCPQCPPGSVAYAVYIKIFLDMYIIVHNLLYHLMIQKFNNDIMQWVSFLLSVLKKWLVFISESLRKIQVQAFRTNMVTLE